MREMINVSVYLINEIYLGIFLSEANISREYL